MPKRRKPLKRPRPPQEPDQIPLPRRQRPSNAFEPTEKDRAIVRNMAGAGFIQDDICLVVLKKNLQPISINTLRKHFGVELRTGKVAAIAQVAGFLFDNCKNGNVSAQIFFLKTQGGWKEQREGSTDPSEATPVQVIIERKSGRTEEAPPPPAAAKTQPKPNGLPPPQKA